MTHEERETRNKDDLRKLIDQAEFRRFLWRVIQTARIFDGAADGTDQRILNEGRRSLGLEILEMVEAGQPVPHPEGQPILTILQVLREEATQQPGEKPNGRRSDRYDRNNDLGDDGDDG